MKRLYVPDRFTTSSVRCAVDVKVMPMGVGIEGGNVSARKTRHSPTSLTVWSSRPSRRATIALGGNPDHDAPGYFYPTTTLRIFRRITTSWWIETGATNHSLQRHRRGHR